MRKYGFTRKASAEVEGAPIVWNFEDDGISFEITNYYLSIPTHEFAFAADGLCDLRRQPPRVAPNGLAQYDADFGVDFLECKPLICLECEKG